MSNPSDKYDGGIVFYATTDSTPPTYVDVNGQTQTAIVLSSSMQQMPPSVDSAYLHVGGVSKYSFQADVIANEGFAVDLGLAGHFDTDPAAAMGELATFRNDDQQTLSVHSFAVTGRHILQTANLGAIVEGAMRARLGNEVGGQGEVVVRHRVER